MNPQEECIVSNMGAQRRCLKKVNDCFVSVIAESILMRSSKEVVAETKEKRGVRQKVSSN